MQQQIGVAEFHTLVEHGGNMPGASTALAFVPGQKGKQLLTPAILRQLANLWRLPEPRLQAVLVETVERAMTQWPSLIESLPFTDAQRGKLLAHLEANASVAAWRRRAARRKPASGEGA